MADQAKAWEISAAALQGWKEHHPRQPIMPALQQVAEQQVGPRWTMIISSTRVLIREG